MTQFHLQNQIDVCALVEQEPRSLEVAALRSKGEAGGPVLRDAGGTSARVGWEIKTEIEGQTAPKFKTVTRRGQLVGNGWPQQRRWSWVISCVGRWTSSILTTPGRGLPVSGGQAPASLHEWRWRIGGPFAITRSPANRVTKEISGRVQPEGASWGVARLTSSAALTLAPLSSRSRTTSRWPPFDAESMQFGSSCVGQKRRGL